MPAAKVQDIVNAMYPILHISFLERLPPEVCLKILGLLDPYDLISLTQCSKQAAGLSSDWTLWQNLYYREGFLTNQNELAKFEKDLKESNERLRQQQLRIRPSTSGSGAGAPPRKRSKPTPGDYREGEHEMIDVDPAFQKNSSMFGTTSSMSSAASVDTPRLDWDDASDHPVLSPSAMSPMSPQTLEPQELIASPNGRNLELPPLTSSMTTMDRLTNQRKLNWQFLYTQRRRLEANWANERYTNYQIPHPDHPEEAHTDSIYTVQHDGTYLVTGSRDQTIRIWSLDTCRLVRPPLVGHRRSVLCLQYDASPEQDVIISGSSDGTVRIWCFSTGRAVQVIKNAHDSSVLNLRFNSQILVTCSKDKTLKIFNRRELHPGEVGYKLPEDFVFQPVPQVVNYPGMVPNPYGDLPVKDPYSVIGILKGHGAAVNYCQILGDEVVSASGDRLAKVWDWTTGECKRSLVGHTKGVACVVYDGRRIVTGSSDCGIKIFDRQTGVEVAALKGPGGHTDLVRTLQAGFADAGDDAELREADRRRAWQVDNQFLNAWSERPDFERAKWAMDVRSRSAGNAGSERPEDIICYGATLPPGGGGSRYGRIVSGSYDENIIIWRKDQLGVWKPKTVLHPADAMRSALLQYELTLPQPPRRPDLVQQIVHEIAAPRDTSAWWREFMIALINAGPDKLRLGLAEYPILMHHSPRLLSIIRDYGGTRPSRPTGDRRVLNTGGMVIKNRLRAIVHAAMYREMQTATFQLMRYEGHEAQLKKWIGESLLAINAAEYARDHPYEPLGPRDAVWRQKQQQYKMQVEKRFPPPKPEDDGSRSGSPARVSEPNGDAADSALVLDNVPDWLTYEDQQITKWRKQLEDINEGKEATRNHHRLLSSMLHQVDPPTARTVPGAGAAGGAGGAGAGAAAAGGAGAAGGGAAAGGDGDGDGDADEAGANWQAKVYNLRFDARRIVCASSNPIILIWDFAKGDRDIEMASRFFKGVAAE